MNVIHSSVSLKYCNVAILANKILLLVLKTTFHQHFWRYAHLDNNVSMKIGRSHNCKINYSKQYSNAATQQQFPEQQTLKVQSHQATYLVTVYIYVVTSYFVQLTYSCTAQPPSLPSNTLRIRSSLTRAYVVRVASNRSRSRMPCDTLCIGSLVRVSIARVASNGTRASMP